MRYAVYLLCVGGLMLGLCQTAPAQLTWERTEQRVEVGWEQEVITAKFPFRNEGDYALAVLQVEAADKGLRATIGNRKVVEKGQSGEATLSLANRGVFGEMTYTATVKTDERSAPQVLVLHVVPEGWDAMSEQEKQALAAEGERLRNLPPPLVIEPRVARWLPGVPGEPPEAKTITITVKSDEPVRVTGLKPIGDRVMPYGVSLRELEAGRRYEVKVTPQAAKGANVRHLLGVWALQTDMSEELQKRQQMAGDVRIVAMTVNPGGVMPVPAGVEGRSPRD